jgi:hypothetical protein
MAVFRIALTENERRVVTEAATNNCFSVLRASVGSTDVTNLNCATCVGPTHRSR